MESGAGTGPVIKGLVYHQKEFGLHSFLQKLFVDLALGQEFFQVRGYQNSKQERQIPAFIEQNKNSCKHILISINCETLDVRGPCTSQNSTVSLQKMQLKFSLSKIESEFQVKKRQHFPWSRNKQGVKRESKLEKYSVLPRKVYSSTRNAAFKCKNSLRFLKINQK